MPDGQENSFLGAEPPEGPPKISESWGQVRPRFKNRILAGLIFIVPVGVTGVVGWWIYTKCVVLTNLWVHRVLERVPDHISPLIQFAGVIVTLFAILLILWFIGTISSSFMMRRIVRLVEMLAESLPIVRQVYRFSKRVVDLIAKNRERQGQRVVIIEYPKSNCYVLAFATGETRMSNSNELHVTLFVPTTPNPTSGFMLMLPMSQVLEAKVSIDEAVQMIMSGGIIVPDELPVVPYRPHPETHREELDG